MFEINNLDFLIFPRELIYRDRSNLKDFGVHNSGTLNYVLFKMWKESPLMQEQDAKSYALECFNNAYYICTLIQLEDFPELRIAEYEEKLLNTRGFFRQSVCATSMAIAYHLLSVYAVYDKKYKFDNDLLKNICKSFHQSNWDKVIAYECFHRIVNEFNLTKFSIAINEFERRDIIEATENVNEEILTNYAFLVDKLLSIEKNPQRREYGYKKAATRVEKYWDEMFRAMSEPPMDAYPEQVYSTSNLINEAIELYNEHIPSDAEKAEESTKKIIPSVTGSDTSDTDELNVKIKKLEMELKSVGGKLDNAKKEISDKQKKIEEKNNIINILQEQIKEAYTLPDNITAQQRVRMELARRIMENAGFCEDLLYKWGNKDKAGTIMGVMLDIPAQTCKNYISDPSLNTEYHKKTIDKINPIFKELGIDIQL